MKYERLEKITKKIKKSIKDKDIVLFEKWYEIAKKETKEDVFKKFYVEEVRNIFTVKKDNFNLILIDKVSVFFNNKNWSEILSKFVSNKNIEMYNLVHEKLNDKFYELDFFRGNILNKLYIYDFFYDFENLLNTQDKNQIESYIEGLAINGIKDEKTTDLVFDRLSEDVIFYRLQSNLIKSIENNKEQDIKYYFNRFFKIKPSAECLQLIFLRGCKTLFGVEDDPTDAYLVKRIKEESLLSVFIEKDFELTEGGKIFKKLLSNYLLNKDLEINLISKDKVKRIKI